MGQGACKQKTKGGLGRLPRHPRRDRSPSGRACVPIFNGWQRLHRLGAEWLLKSSVYSLNVSGVYLSGPEAGAASRIMDVYKDTCRNGSSVCPVPGSLQV